MKHPVTHSIIFFDGVCNLCDATVHWVIKHDKKNVFRFASLQSDFAKKTLQDYTTKKPIPDSLVLLENNKIYVKSDAALRIVKKLSGIYSLLYAFIVLPRFVRDLIYDLVAKNRYKWFGKKENCLIPEASLMSKFIDY
jgi:predicted DCC family thiol-disulfide oxidoreductase YuxK